MKGRIGVALRIHLLDQVNPARTWATSACGKWAGRVEVTPELGFVTCFDCKKIDPSKVVLRVVEERGDDEDADAGE